MRLLLIALFGCHADEVRAPASELTPALEPLSWTLGDWQTDQNSQHWIAAGGAIYSVTLAQGSFGIVMIDDGVGTGSADGVLRLFAIPDGMKQIEENVQLGKQSASFTHEGETITFKREGDTLIAGAVTYKRAKREPAPELEAADRAFAADVAKRGVDGLVAAFDPKGGMIRRGQRIEGAGIDEFMRPLLTRGKLAWDPIASGKRGDLGFTIGKGTYTGATPADSWQSSYVTIWHQQSDASWKVLFDGGRPMQKPAR